MVVDSGTGAVIAPTMRMSGQSVVGLGFWVLQGVRAVVDVMMAALEMF